MLQRALSCILFFLTTLMVCGQEIHNNVDAGRTLQQLSITGNEKDRLPILLSLSEWLCEKSKTPCASVDSATAFAHEALRVSNKYHYTAAIPRCYLVLSKTAQINHQYQQGKAYALQAVELFSAAPDYALLGEAYVMAWSNQALSGLPRPERIEWLQKAADAFHKGKKKKREADCYKELGDIFQLENKMKDALSSLHTSLRLFKEAKYERLQGVYDLLGVVYATLGDYQNGIQYGLLAVQTAENVNDTSLSLCTYYNRIGLAYKELKDTLKCRLFFSKALAIAIKYKDLTSIADLAYNSAEELVKSGEPYTALQLIKDVTTAFPEVKTQFKTDISLIEVAAYGKAHAYNKAIPALQYVEAQADSKKLSSFELAFILETIIPFYLDQGDHKKAEKYIKEYKRCATQLPVAVSHAEYYNLQYRIDTATGNYRSALANYRQYKNLQDSLFNESKSRQIAHFGILYETEKKDKDLQVLKKESELQQNNLRQADIRERFALGLLLLLIVIVLLLCYGFMLKKKSNKTLMLHQAEINEKNEALHHLVQEKDWLMKEIHHRVKNNLHMVVGLLASQTEFIKGQEAMHVISESQHRVQSMAIIHQRLYQTDNLSSVDMASYIMELTDYLQSSFDKATTIRFTLDIEKVAFPLSHSIPIGLILNEAITNSIKYAFPHSNNGHIFISLKSEEPDQFRLTIKDDGIGMPDHMGIHQHTTLGMTLLKGLSDDIKAALTIFNNNGTCIELVFKLGEPNNTAASPQNYTAL